MITNLKQNNPVDFLIVGAAKAGTTTLFEALGKHPEIFIPQRKECRYFSCMPGDFAGPLPIAANEIIRTPQEYRNLFSRAKPRQLRGDISPEYLYYHRRAVPKILNEVNAQVPIIIILRNPIDRAYSNYLMKVRERQETLNFEAALEVEGERLAAHWAWGWGYVDVGLYAEQVKAYLDNFERVLLMLFEEDIVTGRATGKILDFLGIEALHQGPDNVHVNVSGYPKNRILHRLMTDELVVRKVKNMVKATPLYLRSKRAYQRIMATNLRKEAMSPQAREMLKEKFQDDVALLEEYTGLPVRQFWTDFQ